MAKKKQFDYFAALNQMSLNTLAAAKILAEIITTFNRDDLLTKGAEIHRLEQENDQIMDETDHALYISFITPIDREDLFLIKERLDDIIDEINGTTYLLENLVITSIRPGTELLVDYFVQAAVGIANVTKEFGKFKQSKTLKSEITAVSKLESAADVIYSRLMKQLFTNEKDPAEIIKWKEIFDSLERIINCSEKAAKVMNGLMIKNS